MLINTWEKLRKDCPVYLTESNLFVNCSLNTWTLSEISPFSSATTMITFSKMCSSHFLLHKISSKNKCTKEGCVNYYRNAWSSIYLGQTELFEFGELLSCNYGLPAFFCLFIKPQHLPLPIPTLYYSHSAPKSSFQLLKTFTLAPTASSCHVCVWMHSHFVGFNIVVTGTVRALGVV